MQNRSDMQYHFLCLTFWTSFGCVLTQTSYIKSYTSSVLLVFLSDMWHIFICQNIVKKDIVLSGLSILRLFLVNAIISLRHLQFWKVRVSHCFKAVRGIWFHCFVSFTLILKRWVLYDCIISSCSVIPFFIMEIWKFLCCLNERKKEQILWINKNEIIERYSKYSKCFVDLTNPFELMKERN